MMNGISRRAFLELFLGGIIGFLFRKVKPAQGERPAMYWRIKHER